MSRVERNKDQYSKADKEAIENSRAARNAGGLASDRTAGAESAQNGGLTSGAGAAGTGAGSAQNGGLASQAGAAPREIPQGRVGRAERNAAEEARVGRAERNAAEEARLRSEAEAEARAQAKASKKRGRKAAIEEEDLGIWDQTEEEKKKARKEARKMGDGRPEFHFSRLLGKLVSFIGTLILIAAIIACLGLTVPRFVGIEQYVVISGSMEPAIPVGSMVYSAQVDPSTLTSGDIIVFFSDEAGTTPVTHRVVENKIADGEVITKGDANEGNDLSPVTYANILGKVQLSVPMLGYIASPLATLMGKIAMGCVLVGAYILTLVGASLKKK